MSVYKSKNSRYWQYDFQAKGRRFHGSTGVESKRAAEQVERNLRQQAALGLLDDASTMTLDLAAGRWWSERGSGLKDAERLQARIDRMIAIVGAQTPINAITTQTMAVAIQRRRGQSYTKTQAKDAKVYLPSNSTVNRDMIDALRPILNRARKAWGATLPTIDWETLRLKEPKAAPKEFAAGDIEAVMAHVRPHWHDLIRLAMRYGCRLSELFFSLDDLDVTDLNNARVRLRQRKGGDDHIIPLLAEDAAMLAARKGRAQAAGLETVWFRERASRSGTRPAKLVALKYNGAAIALRRAMTKTGLREAKGLRGAHAMRHHSAMQMLRQTENIRLAQKLLGHADIKSTMVYAHALESDLKNALAKVSRNSPGAAATEVEEGDTDQRHTG